MGLEAGQQTAGDSADSLTGATMKRCPYCGKEHPDEAAICDVDQAQLTPELPGSAQPQGEDSNRVTSGAPSLGKTFTGIRVRPTLLRSVYGAILFGAITVFAMSSVHNDLLYVVMMMPAWWLRHLIGLDPHSPEPGGFFNSVFFLVSMNAIVGAALFGTISVICAFRRRTNQDK
jgi:hypothetical protein